MFVYLQKTTLYSFCMYITCSVGERIRAQTTPIDLDSTKSPSPTTPTNRLKEDLTVSSDSVKTLTEQQDIMMVRTFTISDSGVKRPPSLSKQKRYYTVHVHTIHIDTPTHALGMQMCIHACTVNVLYCMEDIYRMFDCGTLLKVRCTYHT